MIPFRQVLVIVLVLSAAMLAACGSGATVVGIDQSGAGGAVGPQQIAGATEVVKFDPANIPLGDRQPVGGTCAASAAVPGAYRCELDGGGAADPCFASSGARLICNPDPVAGSYQTLVTPGNPLPQVPAPPPDRQAHFFVELDGGRACALRTSPEPVIIGGVTALYDCNEPYTYLLGFEKSAPVWEAALYTLDPATGESPSGKVPVNVVRAWIP